MATERAGRRGQANRQSEQAGGVAVAWCIRHDGKSRSMVVKAGGAGGEQGRRREANGE